MSVSHNIKGNIAVINIEGHFTLDELLDGFRQTLNDNDLKQNTHIMINGSKSKELPPTEILLKISEILCEGKDKFSCRLAILVSQNVRFGMARQLGAFLDSHNVSTRPFYDHDEAVEWLESGQE